MIKEIKINDLYDEKPHNLDKKPKGLKKKPPPSIKLTNGQIYSKGDLYEMAQNIKKRLGGGNIKLSNLKKDELFNFVSKYQLK